MYRGGYFFVARYVGYNYPQESGNLTSTEADNIHLGNLAILVIQHPDGKDYATDSAAEEQGISDGLNAIKNAQDAGLPDLCYLYVDIEGFGSISQAVAYANGWRNSVANNSVYYPAVYCGAGVWDQLNSADWSAVWGSPCLIDGIPSGANITQGPECSSGGTTEYTCYSTLNRAIDNDLVQKSTGGFWGP